MAVRDIIQAAAGVSTGPTVIGQAYGGGYYAGKINQGGATYYIIVAPKASGYSSGLSWKTSNTAGPTATITLNNGPAASASMNSSTYPAAQFCEDLSIGGYTDWYLPARDELEICYRNLRAVDAAGGNTTSVRAKSSYTYPEGNDVTGDTMGVNRNSVPVGAAYTTSNPTQTTATLFKNGQSEAFSPYATWSSSEFSSTAAWAQDQGFGGSQAATNLNKTSTGYQTRAIRRVLV